MAESSPQTPRLPSMVCGPLFKEYLRYIKAEQYMSSPGEIGSIGPQDCLLVIDMQNDFISPHEQHNPSNSRFASSESLDIIDPICELMEAFHKAGGVVAATKDYHPWDHCSFIGHSDVNFAPRPNQVFGLSAGFPPHCVQGSQGAKLYPPICDMMCELMRRDQREATDKGTPPGRARASSRCQVAFKGFHEAVDSFGGLEYEADSAYGRFKDVYKKSPCQMSCWTGACVLKTSNMVAWDTGEIQPDNVDAPPDVLSMLFVNRPTPLHEYVRRMGCTRVFICGLVLDCCVVDTAINAKALGFETYIVADASRPAHVAGFGAYGEGGAVGFVNDPEPVREWIEKSAIALAATGWLISDEAIQRLRAHGLPFNDGRAQRQGSIATKPFPYALSLMLAQCGRVALQIDTSSPDGKVDWAPTQEKCGRYSVGRIPEMQTLKQFGFKMEGMLSPLHHITLRGNEERSAIDVPAGSASFAFAYPVDGSESVAKIRESSPHSMQCFTDPKLFFACNGGYVYFDESGKLVGCTALTLPRGEQDGSKVNAQMEPIPEWSDPPLVEKLHREGRFRPVTLMHILKAGVKAFAWVLPGESKGTEAPRGGFCYVYYDPTEQRPPSPPADATPEPLFFPFNLT